jgi:hypothetical protein
VSPIICILTCVKAPGQHKRITLDRSRRRWNSGKSEKIVHDHKISRTVLSQANIATQYKLAWPVKRNNKSSTACIPYTHSSNHYDVPGAPATSLPLINHSLLSTMSSHWVSQKSITTPATIFSRSVFSSHRSSLWLAASSSTASFLASNERAMVSRM